MQNFLIKFKLIFLPFLIIALTVIIGYTLFNFLFLQSELIVLDETVIEYWIPIALPWIPILIWLRPRLNLLRLKSKKGQDRDGFYYVVVGFATIIPLIVAQEYLGSSVGKFSSLKNIEEIDTTNLSKFYSVEKHFIDKIHYGFHSTTIVKGKNNKNLEFAGYVTCPIYAETALKSTKTLVLPSIAGNPLILVDGQEIAKEELDKINYNDISDVQVIKGAAALSLYGAAAKTGAIVIRTNTRYNLNSTLETIHIPKAWLCVKYDTTISNSLSQEDKERIQKVFFTNMEADFRNRDLEDFTYLKRLFKSSDRDKYSMAVESVINSQSWKPILLVPVFEPFEDRSGDKLAWAFGWFAFGSILFFIIILIPKLIVGKVNLLLKPSLSKNSAFKQVNSAFQEFKDFVKEQTYLSVTFTIMAINVVVFIAMVLCGFGFISFSSNDLLNWGANFRPLTISGQWWRLVTSVFLHGGLMHLIVNMYGLLFVGIFLEPMLGKMKFAIIYITTGVMASMASIFWYSEIVSVGASGAIFGMYGVFLAFLITNLFPQNIKMPFLISTSLFVGINLLMGLAGGIDNAAHVGGLISGLLIGFALCPSFRAKFNAIEAQEKSAHTKL
ncbi:MAG: rhomboid family intrarane serine protease [Daejeonella sp.]|nr:rhomboid family intrarane serine protease [Daejeonella sp.]